MNNPFFNNNMAPPFGKSDISNQLIRDSYQYVVQSDTVTGVMYRINGDFLVNPIFASGLTIYTGFTFIDGNQQPGYVLTSDGSGNAAWSPASAATPSSGVTSVTAISPLSASPTTGAVVITLTESYVPVGGGTMTGRLYNETGITVTGDVTSDSIVTTSITAGTISATTLHIENTADISAGSITAETYSGTTIIVNNFTAVTVSATTYLNLPESADTKVTGFSLNNNVITLSQNRTDQYSAFTISLSAYTGSSSTSGAYLPLSGGTVTGDTIFQSGLTANTISATTYSNLPNTLYTGDGTLSGNRVVNIGTNTLNFSSSTNLNTLVLSGGSVGVGKIPSYKLDVDGEINFPTTTGSTYGVIRQNGVRILHTYGVRNFFLGNSGNFTLNSTGSTDNIGIGANTLLGLTTGKRNIGMGLSSLIVNTTGGDNIGIGNGTLQANITGNFNVGVGISSLLSSTSSRNTGIGYQTLFSNITGASNVAIGYTAGYNETGSNKLHIANTDTKTLIYGEFDNDRVGINTTSLSNAFTVSATTNPVKFIGLQSSSDTRFVTSDSTGVLSYRSDVLTTGSTITAATIYNSDGILTGNRIVNLSSHTLNFSSATNPNTLVLSGGSVGIGTTSPVYKLDVNGDINFPTTTGSTYGVIKQNGERILHTYGTDNLFFGKNSGNFITTGAGGNVGIGKGSIFSITTGNSNIGIGVQSLYNTTEGNSNIGIGYATLFSNIIGYNNVAIGFASLHDNIGSNNVAIGTNAGYYETGNNKLHIANTNIKTLIYGEFDNNLVGINTITPTNALTVSATTDPLKLEGVQTSTDTELLTIDGSGVVHKITTSAITSGVTLSFLRNKTHSGATDTIQINESIFNPADLTVLSTSVFIVDTDADYYILGDLYNYGSIIVNGTLKVGGIIYNYGSITGPGIIE